MKIKTWCIDWKAWDTYIIILLAFNLLIWSTPFITMQNEEIGKSIYPFFSLFCHQITQRSFCIYESGICGCYLDSEPMSNLTKEIIVENEKGVGYKLPVCARDAPFYLAMLIGGFAVYFYKGKTYDKPPPLWLFILLVLPLAIDGLTQMFALRESTNLIRTVTGFIAGFAMPFYIIGLINSWKSKGKRSEVGTKNKGKK